MARTTTGTHVAIKNYAYSLNFRDDTSRRITCPGAANYTTNIASNFTVLCLVKLHAKTNTAGTAHALVSNNAGVTSSNYFLNIAEKSRQVSVFITNGTASQNFMSTTIVPTDWCWVGYGYQQGVALKTIVNTTIESTAPTVTHVMDAGRVLNISSTNSNTWIHGNVAKIYLFGGQITTNELNRLVYAGEMPSSLTKAVIWEMTEGSGLTVADTSGNGNTGTLTALSPSWDSVNVPNKTRTIAVNRTLATNRTII